MEGDIQDEDRQSPGDAFISASGVHSRSWERLSTAAFGAALKLLFLAIRNAKKTWGGRHITWSQALLQFAIYFKGRFPE